MPRTLTSRRSLWALLALVMALMVAPFVAPAASASTPSAAAAVHPMETYEWAEVYFGTGEITQGETLQVTVSDLRTGRVITANLGDGAIVVPDIPAADRYGDTGFAVTIPADFPVGVHNLTIGTDEFAPIVIPITVLAGTAPPAETTEPPATTEPTPPATTESETALPGSASPDAADESRIGPPIPASAVIGVLAGIVGLIVVTAIVRRVRNART